MPAGSVAIPAATILLLTPTDGDAAAVSHVLDQGGFRTLACEDVAALAGALASEPAAIILAQEALTQSGDAGALLVRALESQAEWSDVPIILLATPGSSEIGAWEHARALEPVGNISILERPLRRTTLLNAAAVALRARERQHRLRRVLAEREATAAELARHREDLQSAVEQRTAELAESTAALHSAERLAALGTLAAGLGHDIANLTLPIRARLQTLESACTAAEAREDFAAIAKSLDHLSNLSAGMRLMAMDPDREGASTPAADLEAWCAESFQVWRAALPRQIRLECDVPSGLGVNIPRHRLAQAVFNLVQNAGEAMAHQSSGTIRISARAGTNAAGAAVVRLSVEDDGPGMAPEVVARCFEPYFSTKGRAIATGMGLGLIRGIVESAGGTVAVRSAPGEGATFTLTLTATAPDAAPNVLGPRTAAVSIKGDRDASLALMFLGQLAFKSVRHLEASVPDVSLWIAEQPDPALVRDYLEQHPRGRLIILDDHRENHHAPGTTNGDRPQHESVRTVLLDRSPSPGALRDAIARAIQAGAPDDPTR